MMSPEFVFKRKRLCIDINSIVSILLFGKTSGIGRTTKELIYALGNIKEQIPFDIILYSKYEGYRRQKSSTHIYCQTFLPTNTAIL
jgi:hypothetical protein